jgi:DNA-binding CsgD family transcriptional regulator
VTLVERETELDRVTGILHRAAAGTGSVAVVRGPLGIGKSMLLNHIGTRANVVDALVLSASAAPAEREFPYGVLDQLFTPEPTGTGDWSSWLDRDEAVAFHGFHSIVRDLAAQRPVLILVDDLQWADKPSLVFLARLSRRISGSRVSVVVSVLDGDQGADDPVIAEIQHTAEEVLWLMPLSPKGVHAFLGCHRDHPIDEEQVREWHRQTAGNPMLVNALAMEPDSAPVTTWQLMNLTESISRCLRLQPRRVPAMAEALAVLGSPTDAELVRQVADLDEVDAAEATRALRALGLLASGPELEFAAPIVPVALRRAMTVSDTKRMELRAAEALYGVGSVEQLAGHLADMTSPGAEWTVDTLRAAATAAMTRGDVKTAVRYLRRALVAGPSGGADRGRLLAELAAAELNHDVAAAVRHIHQAMPLLPSARERASALCAMPVTTLPSGPVGLDLTQSIAAELGDPARLTGIDRDLALRLEARRRLAGQDDITQLADAHDRFRALGAELPLDSPGERELSAVLLYAGVLAGRIAPDVVSDIGNRILAKEPGGATRSYSALSVMTTTLLAVESVRDLEPWLGTAADDAHRRDLTLPLALIRSRQAMVHLAAGRLPAARDLAEQTIDDADSTWLEVIGTCAIVLCAVAVELRDHSLAEETLRRCLRSAEKFQLSVMLGLLRGTAALSAGQLPAAVEHFADLGRHLERIGWRNNALFSWRARLVTLHARLGNTQLAVELSEQNLEEARESGVAGPIGRALRLCGALATGTRSVVLLNEAVETLTSSINTVELAKARALLGSRLQQTGDESAIMHLRAAHRLAVASGMTWLADQTSAALRGQRQLSREDDEDAGLTTTERLVVDLVAGGHRNKEIAERLGVGPRTIEKHLTRVYRKLGVSGRPELLDALPGSNTELGGRSRGFQAG